MMDEFEKRVEMLKALNVEYTVDDEYRPKEPPRNPHPIRVFHSVRPPFTADIWCALFMKEGHFYLGGCCGNLSALQDELCTIIRLESGWFSIEKLSEIAEIMIDHGEDDDTLGFGQLPPGKSLETLVAETVNELKKTSKKKSLNPWFILPLIWHITKDHWAPHVPTSFGDHVSEVDRAVSILSNGLTAISFDRLFHSEPEPQHQGNRVLLLTRMLPAWKTLNEKIHELGPSTFEGFGLVEVESPDQLCRNGLGYCLFASQEDVDHMLDLWRRQDKEYEVEERPPIDERIRVRKVRISLENGVEFLD